jgi:peptide/nickel transport system permease protein
MIYPVGFCIVATVMACNFIGDALRDALDVRLRRR